MIKKAVYSTTYFNKNFQKKFYNSGYNNLKYIHVLETHSMTPFWNEKKYALCYLYLFFILKKSLYLILKTVDIKKLIL